MSFRTMMIAASGFEGAATAIDVTANNIANVGSNGFKRQDTRFQDQWYATSNMGQVAPGPGVGIQYGNGTLAASLHTDHAQGVPLATERPLDLAINGPGFFRVRNEAGEILYTRNGSFLPKEELSEGLIHLEISGRSYTLDPPLRLTGTPGAISVSPDGQVIQGTTSIGQIEIATFRNPAGLIQRGDLMFSAAEETPSVDVPGVDGRGQLIAGALEQSNVDLAIEFTDLLLSGRMFSLNSASFRAGNETLQSFITLLQRL